MPLKLKDEFKNEVVGFNNSGLPLGERDDLHHLVVAGRNKNPALLNYFDDLPSDDELDKAFEEEFNKKRKYVPAAQRKAAPTAQQATKVDFTKPQP